MSDKKDINDYGRELPDEQEAIYILENGDYLLIQACEDGWDYTLFDASIGYIEVDGGQLDNPELSITDARDEILEWLDRTDKVIKALPAEVVDEIISEMENKSWAKTLEDIKNMKENGDYER